MSEDWSASSRSLLGLLDGGVAPSVSFLGAEDGASEITFGGYRPELLASEVVWAPVTRESYWQAFLQETPLEIT